jgi:type VI secretion system protein ImpJ
MTTTTRDIPDLVQWHEGMLLAPQHFQQLALRSEALLQYHIGTFTPYSWGVRRLRVDPVALLTGLYRITELEAVMPDGLVITREPGDPGTLELSLADYSMAAMQSQIALHLVVPSRNASSVRATGEGARYASYEDTAVTDMNTGDSALPIPRLRPQPMLVVAEAPPEKYVSIPLARIAYRDEAFQLDDFIPPTLFVSPDSQLGMLSSDIARRVREKAAFLADRARATAAAEHDPLVVAQRRMAQSLAVGLPPVEVLLRAGIAHPFQLYLALAGLVGHAAGAGSAILPPVLRGYSHSDLRGSFAEIERYFEELLGGIREDYQRITFLESGPAFELTMQPAWLQPGRSTVLIGALASPGVAESDLAAWFDQAVIAGAARMSMVRERRIRGCTRSRVSAPETLGLAPRRGEVIFAVQADDQYVQAGDALQVLHPVQGDKGRPRELVFYAATN